MILFFCHRIVFAHFNKCRRYTIIFAFYFHSVQTAHKFQHDMFILLQYNVIKNIAVVLTSLSREGIRRRWTVIRRKWILKLRRERVILAVYLKASDAKWRWGPVLYPYQQLVFSHDSRLQAPNFVPGHEWHQQNISFNISFHASCDAKQIFLK